jgi:hypothetical protein
VLLSRGHSGRGVRLTIHFHLVLKLRIRRSTRCIQKFPDWPPGARTANGTALCYYVQFYCCFVSQSREFCHHNPLCYFSTSVCCCKRIIRYDSVRKLLVTPSYLSLLHWAEHTIRLFENRVLRRIFGHRREDGEDCILRSFITCTLPRILLG